MAQPPESAFLSSDVALNIKLNACNLHGSMPEVGADGADRPLSYADGLARRAGVAVSDLYLSCQLHAHGQPLGLPERTCNMPGSRLRWNEWITFRAKYCDLSPDAWVALTLVGSAAPSAARTIGTARLALFNDAQQLRTGVVTVLLDVALDENGCASAAPTAPTADAAIAAASMPSAEATGSAADVEEMSRLEELASRHEEVTAQADPHLDWLNRPTFQHLEKRQHELSRRLERHLLSLQLPDFEYPVLFHERSVSLPLLQPRKPPQPPRSGASSASVSAASSAADKGEGKSAAGLHDAPIVLLSDLESHRDNPALYKHHKLARSLLSAGFAKELKATPLDSTDLTQSHSISPNLTQSPFVSLLSCSPTPRSAAASRRSWCSRRRRGCARRSASCCGSFATRSPRTSARSPSCSSASTGPTRARCCRPRSSWASGSRSTCRQGPHRSPRSLLDLPLISP